MACLFPLVLILIFTVAVSGSSICPDRQSIEESLKKVHIPGAVIIVVNATDILYEQAFGYHSLSPIQPMDADKSIFTLASISKTFISVAVMQLVEKELVDLDADVNQYLSEPNRKIYHPRYPSHSITLRELLSHSASIAVTNQDRSTYFQPNDIALNKTTLADMCFTYLSPNTSNWLPKPPGSVTFYSNEGASLAALVVERITKTTYDQYVKENILKPSNIDIHKASFRLTDIENREDLVNHYVYAFNASFLPGWR
jgi:CubicO group peptidase (beta-lactamase class C family)